MTSTDDLLARVLEAVRQAFLDEQLPTHPEIPEQVKIDRVWAGVEPLVSDDVEGDAASSNASPSVQLPCDVE